MVTVLAFMVLGGGAWAAFHLPRDSVTSRTIKDGQVKHADLSKGVRARRINIDIGLNAAPRTIMRLGEMTIEVRCDLDGSDTQFDGDVGSPSTDGFLDIFERRLPFFGVSDETTFSQSIPAGGSGGGFFVSDEAGSGPGRDWVSFVYTGQSMSVSAQLQTTVDADAAKPCSIHGVAVPAA